MTGDSITMCICGGYLTVGKREWDRSPMYQYMSDDQKGRHGRVVIDIVQKGDSPSLGKQENNVEPNFD